MKLKPFAISMLAAIFLSSGAFAFAAGGSPFVSTLSPQTRLRIAQTLSQFPPMLQRELQKLKAEQAVISRYRSDLALYVLRLNTIRNMPMDSDQQRAAVAAVLAETQTKIAEIKTGFEAIQREWDKRSALIQQISSLISNLRAILATPVNG